jgi:hypothetical protein
MVIIGLTSLGDLGLVGMLTKFGAEYYAQQDFHALDRLLSSALTFLIILFFLQLAEPEWSPKLGLGRMHRQGILTL